MEEIRKKLTRQASKEEVERVSEVVREKLLATIPNYYIGGATSLLENVIRRWGGNFHTPFRLGYAGFDGKLFYISYDYYDYTFDHIKVEYKTLSDGLFLTSYDIEVIVNGLADKVAEYLEKYGD